MAYDPETDDPYYDGEDTEESGYAARAPAQAIPTRQPPAALAPAAPAPAAPTPATTTTVAPAPAPAEARTGYMAYADSNQPAPAPRATPVSTTAAAGQGALPRMTGPPSFAPKKSTKFDPSTATYDADADYVEITPPPEDKSKSQEKISWSDYGKSVWTGVVGMGEDLVNAGKFVAEKIGASPETQAWIERQRQGLASEVEATTQSMTPRAQEAMHASLAAYLPGRYGLDAQGNKIPTPGEVGWGAWLGMSVAQLVPSVVAAVVPGSIMGKVAVKALGKVGVATEAVEAVTGKAVATTAAKAVGTTASMGTTGGLFGAQNAGAVYGEIVDQIGKASDKELMSDPSYAKDRQGGMSVDDAKKGMVNRAGNAVGIAAGVGAVAGVGTGGLLTGGALGGGKRAIGRAALGAAEGGGLMGGQAAVNAAIEQDTTGKPIDWNSVLAAGVSAGIPGVALGAGAGAMHGGRGGREAAARKPTQEDVQPATGQGAAGDPTTGAALADALTVDLPEKPADPAVLPPTHQPQPTPPEAQPELTPAGPTHVAETSVAPTGETSTVLNAPPEQTAGAPPPPGAVPAVQPGEAPPSTPPTSLPGAPEAAIPPRTEPPVAPPEAQATPSPEPSPEPSPQPTGGGWRAAGPGEVFEPGRTFRMNQTTGQSEVFEPARAPAAEVPPVATEGQPVRGEGAVEQGPFVGTTEAQPVRGEGVPEAVAGRAEATAPESKAGPDIGPKVGETPIAGELRPTTTEGAAAEAKPTPKPEAAEAAVAASKTKAQTQRDVRKAKMAKASGERMRGEGAVMAEAEAKPVSVEEARAKPAHEQVEQARADAVQNLRDALPKAIEVRKGADVRPLVNRMLRDLSERIGKTDGSKDAIAEMLHMWREGPEQEFPGLATTRRALGAKLMRELTGHDPDRVEVARARAEDTARRGQEVKRAPSSEALEETAVGTGEGESGGQVTDLGEATAKKKPITTDYEKKGADLLDRVLSGEMTPEEAHHEYGPNAAKKSRRVGLRDFAEYVKTRIGRAEDAANERRILEQMAKVESDKTLSPNARRNKLEGLKKELNRTGPEHADELRERVLSRLEDPVGQHVVDEEAARQAKLEALRAKSKARTEELKAKKGEAAKPEDTSGPGVQERRAYTEGLSNEASRFINVANDARAIKPLLDFWRGRLRAGQRTTVHDIVNFLQNSRELRERFAPYHALLGVIKKFLPNIEVLHPGEAFERGHMNADRFGRYEDRDLAGHYHPHPSDPRLDHLVISDQIPSLETFIHESLHAITARYIHELRTKDPHGREMNALVAMWQELRNKLNADIQAGVFRRGFDEERLHNLTYALKDVSELHTHIMTSPDLWAYASGKQASPELRAIMTKLGYPANTGSIWSHFRNWIRQALGIGTPKSASELTMLDHFLAPAQKITERAHRYNEKYLPRDPVLHEPASRVMDVSQRVLSPRAKEAVGDALARADTGRWGDRARRFLLPGATSDAIVDRYHELLPSLGAWRAAGEAIDHAGKTFSDKFSDKVREVTNRWNKLDDPNKLGQLMVDATIGKAHLGEKLAADANQHLKSKAEQAELARLQDRYNKLSPEEKSLYREMRDVHGQMYQHLRDAQMTGLVKGIIPGASETVVKAFKEAAKSKATLDKFIEESNLVPKEAKKLAKGVAEVYARGYVAGDYFPLRRYGDYVVRVGNRADPDNYSVEFFDSHAKAVARRAELKAQGVESVHQVARKSTSPIHDLAPAHPAVDELYNTMSQAGMKNAEGVRDMLKGILLEHASHAEAAKTRMRRRSVKGADVNQARILNDEFLNNSMRVGHAEHGLERHRALADMENEVDAHEHPSARPGDAVKARAVYDEMQKRSTTIDPDNVASSILSKVNSFSYAHALLSPSHMLTNTLDAHANSLAFLGARHGIRAGFALTRALTEASPILRAGAMNTLNVVRGELKANDWNLLHVMRDRMLAKNKGDKTGLRMLFDALEKSGMVEHTQLQDIRQSANPPGMAGGKAGKMWSRFIDLTGAGVHAVDVMNKSAIAKAAYDLEFRKNGGDRAAAVKYAMDMTRKAMPNYSPTNAPRIATARGMLGKAGAPLMLFKRYGMHMYSVMANLTRDMAHGENKAEAVRAFAGIIATHAMIAGTFTWIADPLRYIMGAYDLVTGNAPHNYQNDLRNWMADTFGKEAGEVLSRGLPHMIGMDLHNRVGMANVLNIPELKSFDKAGFKGMLADALLGAPGSAGSETLAGMTKLIHGDMSGIADVLPRELRDLWKAKELAEQGVTSKQGAPGLPAGKLTARDIIYQAAGFRPSQVSEFQEGKGAVLEARDEARRSRADITQRWLHADPSERQHIWAEAIQWNADPAHKGQKITRDQLVRDLHAQQKQAKTPFGLRLPKKAAPTLSEAGAFANVQ